MSNEFENIAADRADWLLDAIATATQDRRFLRGDPAYDADIGEVIMLNAKKAILVAFDKVRTFDNTKITKAARP